VRVPLVFLPRLTLVVAPQGMKIHAASSTTQSVSTMPPGVPVRSAVQLASISTLQLLLAQPPQQEERTRTQIAALLRQHVLLQAPLVPQATRRGAH
jgi:hypothetical protein